MRGAIIAAALVLGGNAGLFAAPLDGSYTLAPAISASAEEKAAASRDARLKVLYAAGQYENTPYRYGGLDRNGLDCSGLIYLSFRDALGVSLPRSAGSLYAWVEKIPDEQMQPGDLLFFMTTNAGNISHAAIYAGGGRFIHAASEGPATGVIYSGMDERYWSSRYMGAGRALPKSDITETRNAAPAGSAPEDAAGGSARYAGVSPGGTGTSTGDSGASAGSSGTAMASGTAARPGPAPAWDKPEPKPHYFTLGFALAPSWNGFNEHGGVLRGFASQVRLGYATSLFNKPMLFGAELRPEWDEGLGVFRLPITVSWGFDDRFRVFLGPAFSIGDAALETSGGKKRNYSGGTSFLGAVGFTAAPFLFNVAGGELAPYAELAWQSYISDSSSANLNADLAAGMRFSTGIRYTWKF